MCNLVRKMSKPSFFTSLFWITGWSLRSAYLDPCFTDLRYPFYIIWGYWVFLWELQQYFSPMVLPLVSLEMLKHLCFLLVGVLSENFIRWHLTSSSVPPVGWTAPSSCGLNKFLCFSPSLARTSQSPEWAPHKHRVSAQAPVVPGLQLPAQTGRKPCPVTACWDSVQEWDSTVCTYMV